MSFSDFLCFTQSNPCWDIVKSFISYYGLRDYLTTSYLHHFNSGKTRTIYAYRDDPNKSGEEYFWKEVFSGNIMPGTIIKLLNFQISPWFPRKPGLYWTYDAAKARKIAWENHVEKVEKDFVVFDVYGKTLMSELGGTGCVNFRKNRNDVLLTATASGITQRGIPLIAPLLIWKRIDAEIQKERMIEVDLVGTVEEIPLEYDSPFLRSPGIPKIALKINSILNIKFKVSQLKINVTPWTIFELSNHDQPYGFTYINHDLYGDNMDNSVRWMLDYIKERNGKVILTDFDEGINLLNAKFPLEGCVSGDITSDNVHGYCQKIYNKFRG